MSTSAEIDKSFQKIFEETNIEWKVTDFSAIKDEIEKFWSPTFSFADASWYLELHLESYHEHGGIINLFLINNMSREYAVEYDISFKKLDGSLVPLLAGILDGEKLYNDSDTVIESLEALRRKCELTTKDALTVSCTLKRGVKRPKLEKLIKLETLSENFKDLFRNEESCDATLHVKDKEYKVHKTVLIARSTIFSAMFQHEMSEKQTGIVNIPDCDSSSFKQFLEYLYCGKLDRLSFENALNLYETSDKYNVQELKTFCTEFLREKLTLDNLCDIIILADKYDDTELFSEAQDFFNRNNKKVFQTSGWEYLMKHNYRLANKLLKEIP